MKYHVGHATWWCITITEGLMKLDAESHLIIVDYESGLRIEDLLLWKFQ